VRLHLIGNKRLRHRVVGDLDLRFETMELPADPGLALLLYTPEPNSETEQALTFLASWAGGNASAEPAAGHQPALLSSATRLTTERPGSYCSS
jgi:hypothetical protein